jgi:uncharacterized protein (TIGR01777 family)
MSNHVLVTGGSGLVGSRLTELLRAKGYVVSHLSRSPAPPSSSITTYQWDVKKQSIDPQALAEADYVIHLAGAGVADQRWTDERKQTILSSRTESTKLLRDAIASAGPSTIKAFVSASAIGIYGADTGDVLLTEESPAADDFLADVVVQWEAAVDTVEELGVRTVKLRIGIVLSPDGGALPPIARTVRWGVGAPLGSGEQYLSWIHIDDLCRLLIHALENEDMTGIYNAVGPQPVTNQALTRTVAQVMHRPLWMPNVPGFALKLALGKLASAVLGGNRVSSQKIEDAGFRHKFNRLDLALADLLK